MSQPHRARTKPVSSGRKPKGQGQDRRKEILEAASAIYLEQGEAETTIRSVAERVGVSSTAIYVYFQDKDALIAELCDIILEPLFAFTEAMAPAVETAETAEGVSDLLERFFTAFIRFGLSHPQAYFRVFMDPHHSGHYDHRTGQTGSGHSSRVNLFGFAADLVRRAQAVGLIRPGDPWLFAEVGYALLHGLVAMRIADFKAPYAPVEDHIRVAYETLRKGMAP